MTAHDSRFVSPPTGGSAAAPEGTERTAAEPAGAEPVDRAQAEPAEPPELVVRTAAEPAQAESADRGQAEPAEPPELVERGAVEPAEAEPADRGQAEPAPSIPLARVVAAIASVVPPVAAITALLVYFGWARSSVQAQYLGFDESVLGMSTRDYVLRSIDTLFVPLAVVCAVLLGWLALHRRVTVMVEQRPATVRTMGRWLWWSWIAVPAAGLLVGAVFRPWFDLLVPLFVAAGICLAAYGSALIRLSDTADPHHAEPPETLWSVGLRRTLVGVLVVLALFWELANFAGVVGRGLARETAATIDRLPGVVVFSPQDLQISGPGVTVQRFPAEDSAYRVRYAGLRLLQRSGGAYHLVPDGWTPQESQLIVLPEGGELRLEFVRD